MFMLMASSFSLWDSLGVTFMFTNMLLYLCSVFAGLQHSVAFEFTINRAFYIG